MIDRRTLIDVWAALRGRLSVKEPEPDREGAATETPPIHALAQKALDIETHFLSNHFRPLFFT